LNAQQLVPQNAAMAEELSQNATAQHVRGSSLLLVGRILALALGFSTQVLMVRYFSKAEFGAFSYALSVVMLLQGFSMLEMSSAVSRFLPIYRERKEYGRIYGSIVLSVLVVAGLGIVVALGVITAVGVLGVKPTDDPLGLQLLMLLALLLPVQGVDNLLTSFFASVGSSRSILLQSVLAPGLRLALVLGLIVTGAGVLMLTTGYLVVSFVGVVIYAWLFVRLLNRQGLLNELREHKALYPARELFGFALPLLSSTLVWALMESSDGLLLGYFQGTQAVADFRAVLPMAQLCLVVSATFATLYMPVAARLYAQEDRAGLSALYWQSALWMSVLSFPIFVLTFSFAPAVTTGVYGPQYAGSVPVMAILSFGYFFQTALGFNGLTIKVLKKLRYVVSIDIAAAVVNIGINLLLIPRWGAVGAAIGTAATMVAHNILKQIGLWKYARIKMFRPSYTLHYLALFGLPLLLLALQVVIPVTLWVALPVSMVAGLVMFWICRGGLQVGAMFPEVARLPIIGAILRPLVRVP
jgi:O-antigen/teichoic acid export membrane protein